ncbi:hypothetical protein WICMUC_000449 [Wickerhamomyces mucosus]|uniref:Phytanoyl-CoA dioxygenase n=1 Tax=Wickerhamomyces mucosus TaxID=1378264 RepID=A0A9P8PXD1_9ASCO|nr:hypothetical protein WICMUC_000449 [Wickerhamomyces mucosus]
MSATTITTETITDQPKLTLRPNPLVNEKTALIEETAAKISAGSYKDWRDDLLREGYVVIKGAIPKTKAESYQKDIFNWLESFGTELNIQDKSTWKKENLPAASKISSFTKFSLPHEKFFWNIRQEKGFRDAFAKFWGTDELLVSFDSINVAFPGLKDEENITSRPWPHVDQSPYRNGLACIQGIAALSDAGPKDGSLIVYKNSHKYTEQFFREALDEESWSPRDNVAFTSEQLEWFEKKPDVQKLKVLVEPGDLILWDSRTIHYGAQPEADSDTIRTVAYISYSPANFATEESLAKKKEVFEKWGGTSHWAHDNINPRLERVYLPNGELDPRDKGEPSNKPDLTDDLLKLAGVKSY